MVPLVELAAELRAEEKSDAEILGVLQESMGATEAHAQAAIASLDGLAAGGAANRALVSLVARLRRIMNCSDAEIVVELVAQGKDKAAVEGALRGLGGLADGRIKKNHANAASTHLTLVRLAVVATRAWVDMVVYQRDDKARGLSHDLRVSYVSLSLLYGPGEEACPMVKDEAEKQKQRVRDGKTVQDDHDRFMQVKGDLDKAGFWTARAHRNFQAKLTENGLRMVSQRVAPDRGNTGAMSGPGPVSSIGAVRFVRPTWEPRAASPSMLARLVVAVAL